MIKYNLKCHNDHEFESWFSNSKEYDKLNKKGLLECIYCTSKKINKSIMAPTILNTKKKDKSIEIINKDFKDEKNKLLSLRKYIEKNFDYVGKNFAYEARSIHYNNKKKKKGIFGTATKEEIKELKEEGIEADIIPWVEDKDN